MPWQTLTAQGHAPAAVDQYALPSPSTLSVNSIKMWWLNDRLHATNLKGRCSGCEGGWATGRFWRSRLRIQKQRWVREKETWKEIEQNDWKTSTKRMQTENWRKTKPNSIPLTTQNRWALGVTYTQVNPSFNLSVEQNVSVVKYPVPTKIPEIFPKRVATCRNPLQQRIPFINERQIYLLQC